MIIGNLRRLILPENHPKKKLPGMAPTNTREAMLAAAVDEMPKSRSRYSDPHAAPKVMKTVAIVAA